MKQQIEDIKKALQETRAALERPAPVTARVPETKTKAVPVAVKETAPTPSVKAPQQVTLQIEASPPPTVNIEPAEITVLPPTPRAYDVVVTGRDRDGFLLSFRITPA